MQTRRDRYALLARLCLREVDAPLLETLRQVSTFVVSAALSESDEGLRQLSAEYTRLFLMSIHPYESVYVDETAMLNSGPSGAVLQHYREHGFEPPELRRVGAPDHLGLELLFAAHLIERELAARRIGQVAVARSLRLDRQHLLLEHLARWAPLVGVLLQESARAPLYSTLGRAIEQVVLEDGSRLAADDDADD